jgi:hypothetical protein
MIRTMTAPTGSNKYLLVYITVRALDPKGHVDYFHHFTIQRLVSVCF